MQVLRRTSEAVQHVWAVVYFCSFACPSIGGVIGGVEQAPRCSQGSHSAGHGGRMPPYTDYSREKKCFSHLASHGSIVIH